jgi:hypothetical protein
MLRRNYVFSFLQRIADTDRIHCRYVLKPGARRSAGWREQWWMLVSQNPSVSDQGQKPHATVGSAKKIDLQANTNIDLFEACLGCYRRGILSSWRQHASFIITLVFSFPFRIRESPYYFYSESFSLAGICNSCCTLHLSWMKLAPVVPFLVQKKKADFNFVARELAHFARTYVCSARCLTIFLFMNRIATPVVCTIPIKLMHHSVKFICKSYNQLFR